MTDAVERDPSGFTTADLQEPAMKHASSVNAESLLWSL